MKLKGGINGWMDGGDGWKEMEMLGGMNEFKERDADRRGLLSNSHENVPLSLWVYQNTNKINFAKCKDAVCCPFFIIFRTVQTFVFRQKINFCYNEISTFSEGFTQKTKQFCDIFARKKNFFVPTFERDNFQVKVETHNKVFFTVG
jgi:hypothetical protein